MIRHSIAQIGATKLSVERPGSRPPHNRYRAGATGGFSASRIAHRAPAMRRTAIESSPRRWKESPYSATLATMPRRGPRLGMACRLYRSGGRRRDAAGQQMLLLSLNDVAD